MGNKRRTALPDASRVGMVELGCFRLRSVLGRGSCGTAFLAEEQPGGRVAVVKVARSADAEQMADRFASELRAATQIDHPNVVALFRVGETSDGLPALAMEHVPGMPLEDILESRAGDLSPRFVHGVFAQLGGAIAAFHQASVTHRDLSPANIIVGDGEHGSVVAKLIDFGAAHFGPNPGRITLASAPRYAPPEHVIGASGPPCDVYALGAMIWWALSGSEFQPEVRTIEDLTEARIIGIKPKDIRTVVPEVPANVASLVAEMLAFEPSNRPSAADFCQRWATAGIVEPDAPTRRPPPTGPAPLAAPNQPAEPCVALCFDDDPVRIARLREHLEQTHWQLRVASFQEPLETLPRPGALFVSGDLPDGESVSLLRRVVALFPRVTLVAMVWSERERGEMIRAGADFAIRVPFDLPHIAEALEDAQVPDVVEAAMTVPYQVAPSQPSTPQPTAAMKSFLGAAPELMADIDEALAQQNAPVVIEACTQLVRRAQEFDGDELARLATACAASAQTRDFRRAASLGAALENEYANLFRRLMAPGAADSEASRR